MGEADAGDLQILGAGLPLAIGRPYWVMPAKQLPKVPVPKGLIWWRELKRHPLHEWLGFVINDLRVERGWSLGDLHKATGISKSHLCGLEHGEHSPSVEMLLRLEEVFVMAKDGLLKLARKFMHMPPLGGLILRSV